MEAPAVVLRQVVRTFGRQRALDCLDLDVAPGEVVGLLGHNGAGKTTTTRLVVGLLPPSAGQVRVLGLDPAVDGPAVRRRVGVLPSRPPVDGRLTARGNLRYGADLFAVPRTGLAERIDAALASAGLLDRAEMRVEHFSAGMRQRLALARVLLPEPEVLLLDEPGAALDPLAVRELRGQIARLARQDQRAVLLCTHDLAEAEQLCDRVVVLDRGRVRAAGSPRELAAQLPVSGVEIDVHSTDLPVVLRLLPDAVQTGRLADVVTVRVGETRRESLPELTALLVRAGASVYAVRPQQASLEDVYVALYQGVSAA